MLQWTSNRICSAECFPLKKKKKHGVATSPKNNRPLWNHSYSNLSVHHLWLCLLSHFSPDRREAVLLPSLQQGFRRQVQSQGSPTDPFGCEKIPMQELLQNLLQDVSSAQAWGIWLLCSTLNWDTFPPPEKKRKKKNPKKTTTLCCFFIFPNPGELSGNHIEGVCSQDFFFLFLFFIPTMSGPFHFRVRNSSLLTCFLFQTVFLWLQSVSSFVIPPTCAIHALFCMSRMFYTLSRCYL